jgi:nucleotidyltransferase-like protein
MGRPTSIDLDLLAKQALESCGHSVRCLLLIGSFAEGLANAASDIDLVAIVPEPDRRFRVTERGFDLLGRPASVLYVTESILQKRLERLDTLYRTGGHITDGLATRIANAVVLHDSDGVGRRLVFEARRYTPSRAVLQEMMRVALGYFNDAIGSRGDADYGTAAIMARTAASTVVDCVLLERGERNLRQKWHLRRLARVDAPQVLAAYLDVLGLHEFTADDADHAIRQTERLICAVLQVPALDRFRESPIFAQ